MIRKLAALYAVLACSLVWFWALSVRAILYASIPMIGNELHLSGSVSGMIASSLLLGVTLGSWTAGWLPSSRKARILASVLLSFPGIAVLAAGGQAWMVFVAAAALGLANGVYRPLGIALIAEAGGVYKKARYMAIHETWGSLASFCGAAYIGATLAWMSWHESIVLWCIVGVVTLLAFARVEDRGQESVRKGPQEPLPWDRRLLYAFTISMSNNILVAGLISVLPLILVRAWGVGQAEAAWVSGLSKLVSLLGVFLAGARADRWGHARVAQGFQALGVIGCVMMSLGGYGPLFLTGLAGIAISAGGAITVFPAVITEAYPPKQRTRAISMALGSGGLFGLVLCPSLFGALLDAGLPGAPMLVGAAVAFVSVFATNRLAARSRSNLDVVTP